MESIFFKSSEKPKLPEQLSSKWWSKQKQLFASGKETGIGAALDQLADLYKPIKLGNITGREDLRTHEAEQCRKEMSAQPLKAFAKKLTEIKKLATEQAKNFKGSYKKTGDALLEIAEVAQQLETACDTAALEKCLENAFKNASDKKAQSLRDSAQLLLTARDQLLKTKITPSLTGIQSLLQKYVLTRDQKVGQELSGAVNKHCRNMTQVLLNLWKSNQAGVNYVHFDPGAVKEVNDKLTVWGDANVKEYQHPDEAVKEIKDVGLLTKQAVQLLKDVQLPK